MGRTIKLDNLDEIINIDDHIMNVDITNNNLKNTQLMNVTATDGSARFFECEVMNLTGQNIEIASVKTSGFMNLHFESAKANPKTNIVERNHNSIKNVNRMEIMNLEVVDTTLELDSIDTMYVRNFNAYNANIVFDEKLKNIQLTNMTLRNSTILLQDINVLNEIEFNNCQYIDCEFLVETPDGTKQLDQKEFESASKGFTLDMSDLDTLQTEL